MILGRSMNSPTIFLYPVRIENTIFIWIKKHRLVQVKSVFFVDKHYIV